MSKVWDQHPLISMVPSGFDLVLRCVQPSSDCDLEWRLAFKWKMSSYQLQQNMRFKFCLCQKVQFQFTGDISSSFIKTLRNSQNKMNEHKNHLAVTNLFDIQINKIPNKCISLKLSLTLYKTLQFYVSSGPV